MGRTAAPAPDRRTRGRAELPDCPADEVPGLPRVATDTLTPPARGAPRCHSYGVALAFDTSRAPLRPQDFQDLVRAVAEAGVVDESSWVEWKGTLDLPTPEAKAVVARCIVGLANRTLEAASRFCEGRGYMVVGAEPGRVRS